MLDLGFLELLSKLKTARQVLLVSDARPDGDSIGATTATYQWLRRDFPAIELAFFCLEKIPPSLLCLDEVLAATNDPTVFERPWDLIIMHDAGDLKHGGADEAIQKTPPGYTLVNIDHHSTNQRYGHINIVQTDACSTTEVLYRCFTQNNISINAGIATSLLGGLLTDTQSFGNTGTTIGGMRAAAHLIKLGGRYHDIYKSVSHQSVESFHLYGVALSRLKMFPAQNVSLTYFLAEDYDSARDEEATSGLSNFLNTICGETDVMITLKEMNDGTIRVSCRSINRDISQICKHFGGGGHKKAAGFMVNGTLKDKAEREKFIGTLLAEF